MTEPRLSLEDLSRFTGEPIEHLEEWRERGLLGPATEGFSREDIERVRLVGLCLRRGIALDDIVDASRRHGMIERYIEMVSETPAGRWHSLAEAAEAIGLEVETARRLWDATGFAADQGDILTDYDIEAMTVFKGLLEAGFSVGALLEGSRVYADSLARVAEMESKLFHFYIHKRLEAEGIGEEELLRRLETAGNAARPLVEPTILYFHRKSFQRSMREDWVLHVAEQVGLIETGDVPGQLQAAVVFIDLSSFTPLAEAMGDATAAEVLDRFSRIVRRSMSAFDGRVVKQIGDAFMLTFQSARAAVACALEIDIEAAKEPQFPAVRAGIQWGNVLYREGDYVGSNVNIAARLVSEADRHQVLVTADVRREAAGISGVKFRRLGTRTLKGLGTGLELYAAQRTGVEAAEKHLDPVCGMELRESEVAARLTLEDQDRCFCSEDCLRRFVVSPERYKS